MTEPSPAERQAVREKRQDLTADRSERLTKLLLFAGFVITMVVIGVAIITQRTSSDVDRLGRSTDSIQISVRHLEDFVAELEDETPDEAARNQAITDAVNQVPEIRAILCEQFPEATACRGG